MSACWSYIENGSYYVVNAWPHHIDMIVLNDFLDWNKDVICIANKSQNSINWWFQSLKGQTLYLFHLPN